MNSKLYHYCSIKAFKGIISTKTLRLSDVTKSNDKAEIHFLWDNYLEYLFNLENANNAYYNISFDIRRQMECTEFLSLSFSENKDSPYMWQTYSNRGVSIGFDEEKLRNWIENIGQQDNTVAIYDSNIESLIQFDRVKYYNKSDIQKQIDLECQGQPKDKFFEFFKKAPFLKTDYWNQENEWRICIPIILSQNTLGIADDCEGLEYFKPMIIQKEFEENNFLRNKSFCAIPFPTDLIENVTLSPYCKEDIVFIKSFLAANDFGSLINSVERSIFDLSNY